MFSGSFVAAVCSFLESVKGAYAPRRDRHSSPDKRQVERILAAPRGLSRALATRELAVTLSYFKPAIPRKRVFGLVGLDPVLLLVSIRSSIR